MSASRALIRGGGDLASGVAARLHRAGFQVLVTELGQPLVVRRLVSFAEAVYAARVQVEEISGGLANSYAEVEAILQADAVAVLVDPQLECLANFVPHILVDARMRKLPPETGLDLAPLVVGLGPGFTAGVDCHAVVETLRGHTLGRVLWQGQAAPDSGEPDLVSGEGITRVLRAPADGVLVAHVAIGERVEKDALLADVAGEPLRAPFKGALRGMLHPGLMVHKGMKVGDLDPRDDPTYCRLISDKALAIGGGVLEAALSRDEIRRALAQL